MSLLTKELRALIGASRSYTAPEELGRAAIRYFALAIGSDNPVYTSDEAARAAGHDGIVAPPTLIFESNQYANQPRDADGFAGHGWELPVPGARLVRGGNSYEFGRPVRPADVITVTWRLAGMTERAGAAGPMLIVTSVATYTDQHGELLGVNTETLIYLGGPA
jgi:acyl dehydratase